MAGFAGSHLTDYLLSLEGMEVYGVSLPRDGAHNIAHVLPRITLRLADLGDAEQTRELLAAVRPDLIFHLAAQASVERAWSNPAETLVNNIAAQANVLAAVAALGLAPRILIVGSADEYGLVRPEELPITEETPLRPLNPYAVSKVAQDYLGYQYHLSHHLHIVRVRPFNHIGPRQGTGFVVPDFAGQIARIEAGQQEPVLRVGNLDAVRDFSDVRDIVRGYYLALERGRPGAVYNLCSGRGHSIREILETLLGLSDATIRVESDPARMRPSDVPILIGDASRFQADTGWAPRYTLEQSLRDVLADWRHRVRQDHTNALPRGPAAQVPPVH